MIRSFSHPPVCAGVTSPLMEVAVWKHCPLSLLSSVKDLCLPGKPQCKFTLRNIFLGWRRHSRSSPQPWLSSNIFCGWGNLPDGVRARAWIFPLRPLASYSSQQRPPPPSCSTHRPYDSVLDSTLSCSLVVLYAQSYLCDKACDKAVESLRAETVWHVVAFPTSIRTLCVCVCVCVCVCDSRSQVANTP